MSQNPVVAVAKEQRQESTPDTFTAMGVTIQIVGVSPSIVQDAVSRLKPPTVPMWHNPDKARDEPNPNDPGYIADMEAYRQKQSQVSLDAMIMFGADVVEGFPPEDGRWIRKLKTLERTGVYDFDWVDWDDQVDLEYLFLKYVAIKKSHLAAISRKVGLSPEAIAQAVDSFPGDEGRAGDNASTDQE